MAHMLPIYRQRDGVNTKEKNLAVFKKCSKTLLRNRNLLIFGEGVTDDVFVRRLKPIKKGAVRIGFTALESCEWQEDIYIAAVGCNYSEPSIYGSDLLINNSKPIHLNAFRKQYEENSGKIILELTAQLQSLLQDTITHVNNTADTELHEDMMRIQQKGMTHLYRNHSDLESRYKYSVHLASLVEKNSKELSGLKIQLKTYFEKLRELNISDDLLFDAHTDVFSWKKCLLHLFLAPMVLLGIIHCGLFYWPIKVFVERKFRRPVFWSSTKLIMMMFIAGLSNLTVFIWLPSFFGWPLSVLYFCLIPFFGHVFHRSFAFWKRMYQVYLISQRNTSSLWNERMELNHKITTFVK
jgi:hypothetical protein